MVQERFVIGFLEARFEPACEFFPRRARNNGRVTNDPFRFETPTHLAAEFAGLKSENNLMVLKSEVFCATHSVNHKVNPNLLKHRIKPKKFKVYFVKKQMGNTYVLKRTG